MAGGLTLKELLQDGSEAQVKDLSFESGIKLLEELVAKVESGTLPLEQSMLSYERGVSLMNHLRSILTGAEQKLKILQKPATE